MSRLLTPNVHRFERIARIALGAGLAGAALTGAIGAWGYIGVVPLLTGFAGSCPIYTALGIATCPVKTANR